jgi:hypothetical protein
MKEKNLIKIIKKEINSIFSKTVHGSPFPVLWYPFPESHGRLPTLSMKTIAVAKARRPH